jgi:hypothetical protein
MSELLTAKAEQKLFDGSGSRWSPLAGSRILATQACAVVRIQAGIGMTTIKIRGEIDLDGKLRLEVPVNLPAGNAEVLVVIQSEVSNGDQEQSHGGTAARSGLFAGTAAKHPDVDATSNEMDDAWKSKLTDQS